MDSDKPLIPIDTFFGLPIIDKGSNHHVFTDESCYEY